MLPGKITDRDDAARSCRRLYLVNDSDKLLNPRDSNEIVIVVEDDVVDRCVVDVAQGWVFLLAHCTEHFFQA